MARRSFWTRAAPVRSSPPGVRWCLNCSVKPARKHSTNGIFLPTRSLARPILRLIPTSAIGSIIIFPTGCLRRLARTYFKPLLRAVAFGSITPAAIYGLDTHTLGLRNPDGSVVILMSNHAVKKIFTDNNGTGVSRTFALDLSALGTFTSATLVTLDVSNSARRSRASIAHSLRANASDSSWLRRGIVASGKCGAQPDCRGRGERRDLSIRPRGSRRNRVAIRLGHRPSHAARSLP